MVPVHQSNAAIHSELQQLDGIDIPLNDVRVNGLCVTAVRVKGQTAASSYKPAKLENGLRVMVPPFITSGEKIIVDTNEVAYIRRAE